MIKLFEQCPSCGGALVITECRCPACQLELRGEFRSGSLGAFSDEQMAFIRVFLLARGNLSEVEKVLGISYPTIRNKLDEIIRVLERPEGQPEPASRARMPQASPTEDEKKAILQQVAAGTLSTAEAMLKIKQLGGRS